MSVAEYGKDALLAVLQMVSGILGWIFVAPLAALVPKHRGWIAVIGRGDGKFLDNSKYFFIEASLDKSFDLRVVHVTERSDVRDLITKAGLEALRFPSLGSLWFLARCGSVVVDSVEWCEKWRRFLLSRTKIIQLWHGVGFKRIELDKWRNEAKGRRFVSSPLLLWARMLRKQLRGRIPRYDAVVTTSNFYRENVFKPAFRSRHVITTGYPRNTFGQFSGAGRELAWKNVDSAIKNNLETWRTQGRRIILIAPTFRDSRATPLGLDVANRERLDAFCSTQACELLVKFHPYELGATDVSGQHLHVLDANSDAYPLFPFIDILVTDYSSIYMDFLLLDRPVFFYTPDLALYLSQDRDIQFDFERMTPGPKLHSWDKLIDAFESAQHDAWQDRRIEVRKLAFDDVDQSNATSSLLTFMLDQRWIQSRHAKYGKSYG
jgi:CDP-glycerol glycerophosphotransferase (TagB/SpsB family)